jgi:hypothetical protein
VTLEDAARVERILDDCIQRGLVDEVDGDVRASRAWSAWVQKAAEVVNRQVADTGFEPPGNPVQIAVQKALDMKGEDLPDGERADYVTVLTNLELANMPAHKREQYLERARRTLQE